MGLDLVELVMDVEEAFLISILDDEAVRMRTPRHVTDYVSSRLGASDQAGSCLTQRAFHKVRAVAMEMCGRSRSAISPGVHWSEILPPDRRRRHWNIFRQKFGPSRLPPLTLFGAFPFGVGTVGGTAQYLAERAPASLKRAGEPWNRREIQRAIGRIIQDVTGIEDFDWDDDFVKDLGLD